MLWQCVTVCSIVRFALCSLCESLYQVNNHDCYHKCACKIYNGTLKAVVIFTNTILGYKRNSTLGFISVYRFRTVDNNCCVTKKPSSR